MRIPPFFRRLFKFTSMDFETVRMQRYCVRIGIDDTFRQFGK